MRGTRWLLLVAIAAILAGVAVKYRELLHTQRQDSPPKPASLPSNLEAMSQDYHWRDHKHAKDACARTEIWAHELAAERGTNQVRLQNVTLKLFNKSCTSYDLVSSAAATFYETGNRMVSDGDVTIKLNIPPEGQPPHTPVSVESSAVTFDTESGRAETDKPTHFSFERGEGNAVGAVYDPTNRTLELKSAVVVNWKPIGPHAKPMKIEAGNLVYREATAEVFLTPWGKMSREDTTMEGQNVVINLLASGEGDHIRHTIKQIHADKAHGTEADSLHNRKLIYAADQLVVDYNATGQVQAIGAQGNARMVSTAETSETTVTANHVEMAFNVVDKESHLGRVVAEGHGEVTAKPLPGPGKQELGETHILRSDNLEMKMRPGGRDIETVATHSPGNLEFIPNAPIQHHRVLDGSLMTIMYGAQNRIQQFNVNDPKTRTDPTPEEKKRNRAPFTTASKTLVAAFDPKTSKLTTMEQAGSFTYNENDRKASAAKANLDNDIIILDTGARMSDATSATAADRIRMDQHTGDFTAEGHVKSSRVSENDPKKKTSEMLSGDDPLQAQARKMESHDQNHVLHYEGDVIMWQGANQIKAETVDVDRRKHFLKADGHVVTTFWDSPKPKKDAGDDSATKAAPAAPKSTRSSKKSGATGQPAAPKPITQTVVQAPHLIYTDEDRLAVYSGGADLVHSGMHVTSAELRAHLADSSAESRLENAVADGKVKIDWSHPPRSRVGTSEHAEYYTADDRVLLTGGRPQFIDSCKGSTEGEKLTYFANDDRLLVNGKSSQPAQSRIDRSCK